MSLCFWYYTTTNSSFLRYLFIHPPLPYLLLFFSVEIFKAPWRHWAPQLPLNRLGNYIAKKSPSAFKMLVIAINMHSETYVHWTSAWISVTWWAAGGFAQFLSWGELLQFCYQLKIWAFFCLPVTLSKIKSKISKISRNTPGSDVRTTFIILTWLTPSLLKIKN